MAVGKRISLAYLNFTEQTTDLMPLQTLRGQWDALQFLHRCPRIGRDRTLTEKPSEVSTYAHDCSVDAGYGLEFLSAQEVAKVPATSRTVTRFTSKGSLFDLLNHVANFRMSERKGAASVTGEVVARQELHEESRLTVPSWDTVKNIIARIIHGFAPSSRH